jgi:hypothetical protein
MEFFDGDTPHGVTVTLVEDIVNCALDGIASHA